MSNRFRNNFMRKMYDACMEAVHDKSSEFYLASGERHTGAGHRCCFWAGFDGRLVIGIEPGTLGYAAWRAGQDYKKETT